MAEAVVGGALLRVLQDLVGLVDFLELQPPPTGRRRCGRDGAAWRACGRRPSAPSRRSRARRRAPRRNRVWPSRIASQDRKGPPGCSTGGPLSYHEAERLRSSSGISSKSASTTSSPRAGCAARRRRRRHPDCRRRPLPAAPCTSPRRASSRPAQAPGSSPGCRSRILAGQRRLQHRRSPSRSTAFSASPP